MYFHYDPVTFVVEFPVSPPCKALQLFRNLVYSRMVICRTGHLRVDHPLWISLWLKLRKDSILAILSWSAKEGDVYTNLRHIVMVELGLIDSN